MSRFRYTAFDAAGRRVSSEMEAASAKEVLQRLEAAGLTVESVQPFDAAEESPGAAPPGSDVIPEETEEPAEPIFEPLHRRDFEELTGHVADLTQSDLPLAQGLRAVAEDLPARRLRRGLLQIAAELERGMDLDRVLALHGAPADVRALLKIGRRTGKTTEVLGEYIIHVRNVADVRRRAVLGLAYPLVLLALAGGIFLAFLCGLVPQFEQVYTDFGVELPRMTQSLIILSRNCVGLVIGLFLLAVAVVVGYLLLPERWRQWVLYHVPILGPMLRWTALARFTHLLALLVEHDVPMPEALLLAGDSVPDVELRRACWRLSRDVQAGMPLAPAADNVRGFPATFVQTLMWERHRRAFPEALHAVAGLFESRSRIQAGLIAAVCEPVLLVMTGLLMGYVVLGLFMPLIRLLNDLS